MTTDETIEMTARAIMKLGCGYHFGGEQVLCCDPRVGDEKDTYGEPLLRDKSQCDCMLSARAALAAILPVLREVAAGRMDNARASYRAASIPSVGKGRQEARDYETMAIAFAHAGVEIRARFDEIAKEVAG